MPLSLYIEADRWRQHQQETIAAFPGIVPVVKSNGYGFGNTFLAAKADRLGVDTLAVGSTDEAAQVLLEFSGDVLVLLPYLFGEQAPHLPDRVIRTVASADAAREMAGRRVVVECMTSMRRHGIADDDLGKLRAALDDVRLEGFSLHLPLDRPDGVDPVGEIARWLGQLEAARLPTSTMLVSHITAAELAGLRQRYPTVNFRTRIGTALWLGSKDALHCRATVLDVTRLSSGTRFGYRQRRSHGDGHLVVVAGGAGNGVGLEAPKSVRGAMPRAKGLARAGLASVNRTLSPYLWAGRRCWFAEPPHQQVSLLFLPEEVPPPAVGEELAVELRHTTSHFDRVIER